SRQPSMPADDGPPDPKPFYGLVGQSPQMIAVAQALGRLMGSQQRVLVLGETGTGKELVARALHELSGRDPKPFVAVNCAAIPGTLLEGELFGHEKGAFTGAEQRRRGLFERAHGGTLLLDEIGDMSLEAQAKLLRVLQEGCFERVGGHETITVDVRVVAATHQDLEARIQQRKFGEGL